MTYEEKCLQYSYKIYMQELRMNQKQELAAQKAYAAYINYIGKAQLQQDRQIQRSYDQYNRYLQKIANAQQREINKQEKQIQKQHDKDQAYLDKYNQIPFNMNVQQLLNLGFPAAAIQTVKNLHDNKIWFSTQKLREQGFNDAQIKTIMKIFRICSGGTLLETDEQLRSVLKSSVGKELNIKRQIGLPSPNKLKEFAQQNNIDLRLNVNDMTQDIPLMAIVSNIKTEPYNVWNYVPEDKKTVYRVLKRSPKTITVETTVNPKIEHGGIKKIQNMFEIQGPTNRGTAIVEFGRQYSRIFNRFIIEASFTKPTVHCGCYRLLCGDGSYLYVFAFNIGTKKITQTQLNSPNRRTYDWGIGKKAISSKLMHVERVLYSAFACVKSEIEPATQSFSELESLEAQKVNDYSDCVEF